MKKQTGFTLVELLVAIAVSSIIVGAAVLSFSDAVKVNARVTQMSNMSDNLRAGLNLVVQDLLQAGTGIPTGGIPVPNNAIGAAACTNVGASRPGPATLPAAPGGTPALTFPNCSVLPAIEPGFTLGPTMIPVDGTVAGTTDLITLLYADNAAGLLNKTVVDNVNCAGGTINGTGTSVTFAAACANLGAGGIQVNPGDLIMFTSSVGNAIQTVTGSAGQTLSFAANDPFKLNATGQPSGTILQIKSGANFPNGTTATRIWLITYYLDKWTNPQQARLIRQVNFNPPQPVGETIESLNFTYDYINGTPVPLTLQTGVPVGYTEGQIRSVNVSVGTRSDRIMSALKTKNLYLRNNLTTQVTIRSLAFYNKYN
jgi:prepilin-type N-terminal cleavage/methylation domain-containing protein